MGMTLNGLRDLFPFNYVEIYAAECQYTIGNVDDLLTKPENERPIPVRGRFEVEHFSIKNDTTVTAYIN